MTEFLTMIQGEKIIPSPPGRIIKKALFSDLLRGEALLKKIEEDTREYKKQVVEECDALKEAAEAEGYLRGFSLWIEKLVTLEQEVSKYREELSKQTLPIALKLAKKIVGDELKQQPDAILNMIQRNLKAVKSHKKIIIWVSRQEFQRVDAAKESFKKQFEEVELLSVRQKEELSLGDCMIETEGGIINARLDHIWGIIEKAFEKMPPPKAVSEQGEL
jgi:Flagellar biosynthesis/type III secretory pathway protein